jgi:hypothetical protein
MFDPFLIYAFRHLNYTICLYDVDVYFYRPIFPSSGMLHGSSELGVLSSHASISCDLSSTRINRA